MTNQPTNYEQMAPYMTPHGGAPFPMVFGRAPKHPDTVAECDALTCVSCGYQLRMIISEVSTIKENCDHRQLMHDVEGL